MHPSLRRSITTVILAAVSLLTLTDSSWAASCTTATVVGAYAVNLGGVDARGNNVVGFGFVTFASDGTLSGVGLFSERGVGAGSLPVVGVWAVGATCVLVLQFSDSGGFDSGVGYVSNNGGVIQFATANDTKAQITGIGFRVQ